MNSLETLSIVTHSLEQTSCCNSTCDNSIKLFSFSSPSSCKFTSLTSDSSTKSTTSCFTLLAARSVPGCTKLSYSKHFSVNWRQYPLLMCGDKVWCIAIPIHPNAPTYIKQLKPIKIPTVHFK